MDSAHLCSEMNKPLVLLTGADGVLGNHISRELLSQGYQVRAVFEPGKTGALYSELPEIDCREGNILEPQTMIRLAQGCDYIIHAAANTSINPARNEMVRQVNIQGTQNLITAGQENKIKRLVFVGTANSFAPGTKSDPGDESGPYTGSHYGTDYMDSKYEAYKMVKAAVSEGFIEAVTVHPTFMIGPYDTKPSSGAMLIAVYQGKVPGYTKGGRNYIYVKDAATGVVNALKHGASGNSYILGHENLSYREAFKMMAEEMGVKVPKLYIPPFLTLLYGRLGDLLSGFTGKPATVSYPMARISCDEHYYSASNAIRDLDLPQTPLRSVIKESFDWIKQYHQIS